MSTPPASSPGTPADDAPRPAILMVEDDEEVRQLLRITLERGPYDLIEAADGEAGLEMARRWRPRLILLDVQLPGMDGLEVCRRLKADPELRGARVLMLTAAASREDRARGAEAGADGYLTKPFGPIALLDRIATELGVG
jgi:DNA-binding response OmpR family regulator